MVDEGGRGGSGRGGGGDDNAIMYWAYNQKRVQRCLYINKLYRQYIHNYIHIHKRLKNNNLRHLKGLLKQVSL